MVTAGWGVNAVEKGKVDSNEKRSLGPLVMSLEEEVLTLMATAGDQADFIAGGAACRRTARRRCRRRKFDLNWAGVHIAHINAHCRKKQAMCPPCTEQNFYSS